MKHILSLIIVMSAFLSSCDQPPVSLEESEDYVYFVTRLGNDTLAIERYKRQDDHVMAHVVLRSPKTALLGYDLKLDNEGGIADLLGYRPTDTQFNAIGSVATQTVRFSADTLINEVLAANGDKRRFTMTRKPGTLPFIDMVHWPFELAFQQAAKSPNDSIAQKLLTGRRISGFIIHKMRRDSLTFRHPSRGVMGVKTNANGDLLKLDAALTTRKLVVTRTRSLDFEAIANDFLERDKNGSPFGSLSGAITQEFSFKGGDFKVQYGSPQKRGREIFGGIVSWGVRWRTGANRATHFKTSKDLTIANVKVPKGEYTLFTIPEPDGGTLIINKQTGQNGRSYDVSRDLARVPMSLGNQDEITEGFTITVEETSTGGILKLIWDQSVFSVDFTF
ncbi:MAG: DUF2911 domain-containing protein [Roseivirga sp.]|nr:DUF2911 domain-containing protein [Roseivirga sp.]